jgi:serine phosphatase RsbU (regulator of sigma subunit)
MLKTTRRIMNVTLNTIAGLLFMLLTYYLLPSASVGFSLTVASVVFCLMLFFMDSIARYANRFFEHKIMYSRETGLMTRYIERLRSAYTFDDLVSEFQNILENKGDMSILYVNRETNYVMYNSPDKICSSEETERKLELNFPNGWQDGIFFFDDSLGLVSRGRSARGFFMVFGSQHIYCFCRYVHAFDPSVFPKLYEEYMRFEKRSQRIREVSVISDLAKEWSQLAQTQRSFLPQKIPVIQKLDIEAYFRPLVNVSGDYYTVLPMDENKTLVMLGDVSGKGLAAALVMGLVMNTVKIIENKEDLVGVVKAVDKAIKGMHLQDKYTVMFIGIIDTNKMNIRYINASMSDPIIVTKAPNGYRIKPLTSNCSLVGIIDLDDIHVDEQRLFRGDLILMASDGVSEVMDDEGIELGNTELYMNTIKNSAYKSAHHIVNDIANLVLEYNGDKKLRDDVTMLVVKIED